MNGQGFRLRLKLIIQKIKSLGRAPKENDQTHVMTEDELLDEELKETFPASDPPGHFSKSAVDRELH
jgi:hypothetical protein